MILRASRAGAGGLQSAIASGAGSAPAGAGYFALGGKVAKTPLGELSLPPSPGGSGNLMLRCKIATLFSGVELTPRSFSLALTALKQWFLRSKLPAGVAAESAMLGAAHPPRRE